jgi:serralysin
MFGNVEGQRFLGFANVTTDAAGNASYVASFPPEADGKILSATATHLASGDTSEFSGPVTVANTGGIGGGGGTGPGPANRIYAVGAGHGDKPVVRVYNAATGAKAFDFLAFEASNKCGVRVATGDINGNGVEDIVVGTGGKRGEVRVFDGTDGSLIWSALPFGAAPNYTLGVTVAVGDVDGDGKAEVVVGGGSGGNAHVAILNGATGAQKDSFLAFPASFKGGGTVAVGDTDGDGRAEIVVAAGDGSSQVAVFDAVTKVQIKTFKAFSGQFSGAISVAVGDVTGDGLADIVIGAGSGAPGYLSSPTVKSFSGPNFTTVNSIEVFPSDYTGGVRVALERVNADAIADLIVGGARSTPSTPIAPITILNGFSTNVLRSVPSFDRELLGGVFVG